MRCASCARLVDYIHDNGMTVIGWCMPSLGYVNGTSYDKNTHVISNPSGTLWADHKDWFASSTPVDMSAAGVAAGNIPTPFVEGGYYNNSKRYDFCLANPAVLEGYSTQFSDLMFGEGSDQYNFDGLKIDSIWGSHICLATGHGHDGDPNASIKAWSQFYKKIYDKGMALNDGVMLIENCNCGTPMNYFDFNGTSRPEPGDYKGGRQQRYEAKVYKGLYGPTFPISSDHLELGKYNPGSGSRFDYLSPLGTGYVYETKFTELKYGPFRTAGGSSNVLYSDPSETGYNPLSTFSEFKSYFDIYNDVKLSSGNFRGDLYKYGVDYPEAYAIEKGNKKYYSFYATNSIVGTAYNTPLSYKLVKGDQPLVDPWTVPADINYNGSIELRGLTPGKYYAVTDYINNKNIGAFYAETSTVTIPQVSFTGALLLSVDEMAVTSTSVIDEGQVDPTVVVESVEPRVFTSRRGRFVQLGHYFRKYRTDPYISEH